MEPVRFAFGLHLPLPVGNFDDVFQQHVDEVYLPFLDAVQGSSLFPISLHLSGPLLEWLEAHDTRYLDRLGALVADGHVELLLAGLYEPVLAALTSDERREQIGWMREALRRRFGVEATGLWLTERVWDPSLPGDLAAAGVEFPLVDDRHFLAAGFDRRALNRPFRTDADGGSVAIFAIDERLRYLIPFRPGREVGAYLRELEAARYEAVGSLAEERLVITDREVGDASVEVGLRNREGTFHVRLRFAGDGALEISFQWDPGRVPRGGRFAPELSLAWEPDLAFDAEPSDVWRYDIRTVSKSERGLEETLQGRSVAPLWPAGAGQARIQVSPRR